jgi:hypothetical protein
LSRSPRGFWLLISEHLQRTSKRIPPKVNLLIGGISDLLSGHHWSVHGSVVNRRREERY